MKRKYTFITLGLLLIFNISLNAKSLLDESDNNSDNNQKMNLDATTGERFSLTDIIWPTDIGDANVCLWSDDKIAAASLTIDDNIESDHAWWLSMQSTYNLNFTWFIILNSVTSWDKYQTLIDAGNEIQGHDDCYINDTGDETYKYFLELTKNTINSNLINNKCITYAYPCGKQDKSHVAREVYISMRGVTGKMNEVNKANYLDLNSRSATNDAHDIRILLDPDEKLWNVAYYRGWASYHYHTANRETTEPFLSTLSEKTDSIWVGMYSEVARYAQERDSHTLTVDENTSSVIKFTLTDKMHDEYFNFPLSVKIRIDNSWSTLFATQNGVSIVSKIIEFENNKYALVKAIPDKGQVIISNSALNLAPEISTINDTVVNENSNINVMVNATDAEGDEITLLADTLVSFATFTDNGDGTGKISFSPLIGDAGIYNIVVTASDAEYTSSTSFSLVVDVSSAISTVKTENLFNIYPNPIIGDSFTISIKEGVVKDSAILNVVNSLGKLVYSQKIEDSDRQISITTPNFNSGEILIIRLSTNNNIYTQKVITQ